VKEGMTVQCRAVQCSVDGGQKTLQCSFLQPHVMEEKAKVLLAL
jgi:hypothetical protein